MTVNTAAILLGCLVAALAIAYLVSYNSLVTARQQVSDAWAAVAVELERRHSLIPGLVAAVQATAEHERRLLQDLVEADDRARATNGTAAERSSPESEVGAAARSVVALRESYPELNTQQNFLQLQRQLATTEDRLATTRRFHNIKVADFNRRTEAFPSGLVARRHGFVTAAYFGSDNDV